MNELILLLESWEEGTDCRDQIHDCLIELGYPYTAEDHFVNNPRGINQPSCLLAKNCALISRFLGAKKNNKDYMKYLDYLEKDAISNLNKREFNYAE